jgi:hypothetical protein
MKLIKTSPAGFLYFLNPTELQLLGTVLQKFPFTREISSQISRLSQDPQAVERAKLLNGSLAEHRRELIQTARDLVAPDRLRPWKKGHLLTLSSADRETLLQILNDIRVGCWHSLGQPGELESKNPDMSDQEFAWRNLMHLSGYFEHHLVEDTGENEA